ncbi:unnamed protein product [Ranitomeya imitator]|uniref:Flavin-containing monooxygenase n=1 Tax=Ranitomeya imitator TaxID=111125 RepID=A0ABN9LE65_9NEOB|nr:unnamed protein product [Ranitomeya imitator]
MDLLRTTLMLSYLQQDIPFLSHSWMNLSLKWRKTQSTYTENVVPPTLEKPTLGILGLIQPLGSIMPTSELQGRWLTRVFKGLCPYPPLKIVMDDIAKKNKIFIKRFGTSRENRLQVDFVEYLDELASAVGILNNEVLPGQKNLLKSMCFYKQSLEFFFTT